MIKRVVVVPRWGGGPDSDFYPWLDEQLSEGVSVVRHTFLRPDAPRIDEWASVILAQLWEAPEDALIVGHSVGCRAALHALSRLRPGVRVGGLLCVAGWWRVDSPWAGLAPWLRPVPGLQRACAALGGRCRVLLSDNDPHTTDQGANKARWETMARAQVSIVPGAAHFSRAEEPAVLGAVREMQSG